MRILVAEDDPAVARVICRILEAREHEAVYAEDGEEALELVVGGGFDAVVTDWMMPNMDGPALIRRIRAELKPSPVVVMLTALGSDEARLHALSLGADGFIAKPFTADQLHATLEHAVQRRDRPLAASGDDASCEEDPELELAAIAIVTNTGGPPALDEIIPALGPEFPAALFLVQAGPSWMIESLVERLRAEAKIDIVFAADGMRITPGTLYVARSEERMRVEVGPVLRVEAQGPTPDLEAADGLFRSVAGVFASRAIAVVLTGIGADGCRGAEAIARAGGIVVVQSPETCVAPHLPETMLATDTPCTPAALGDIGQCLIDQVETSGSKRRSR